MPDHDFRVGDIIRVTNVAGRNERPDLIDYHYIIVNINDDPSPWSIDAETIDKPEDGTHAWKPSEVELVHRYED